MLDYAGKQIADLKGPLDPGLHRVTWNMQAPGRRGGFRQAPPGTYRVVLSVDGKDLTQGLRIEADPTLPPDLIATEGNEMPAKKKKLVPDD